MNLSLVSVGRFSREYGAKQTHHELKHTLSRGEDKRVGKTEELITMFGNPVFTFNSAALVF